MEKTLAVILGGGAGSRLYPLTRERAKPAVPVGGKYRLIDIPISNCLNSGLSHIFVRARPMPYASSCGRSSRSGQMTS
jgi:glucose-1-phosphate adenylyltransferase